MRNLIALALSAFITGSVVAEDQLKCRIDGEFTTFKKTKVLSKERRNFCPMGVLPPIRINEDGSPFDASCGYYNGGMSVFSAKEGYQASIITRNDEGKLSVELIVRSALNKKIVEKRFSYPVDEKGSIKVTEENLELGYGQEKKEIRKITAVSLDCELIRYNVPSQSKEVVDGQRETSKEFKNETSESSVKVKTTQE